jgi:hypothetical protein
MCALSPGSFEGTTNSSTGAHDLYVMVMLVPVWLFQLSVKCLVRCGRYESPQERELTKLEAIVYHEDFTSQSLSDSSPGTNMQWAPSFTAGMF